MLTTSYGVCQSYVPIPTTYMDFDISKKLIDSVRKNGITDFIIYQTTINRDSLYFTQENDNYFSNMVTYILWNEKGKTKVILITDSCIFQHCITKSSDDIFSYSNLNKLWLRKDEDIYKAIPDYTDPYDKDVVIYIASMYKRFFEYGRNAYYQLNKSRNKYREDFIILLKKKLLQPDEEWRKISNFNRKG